MSNKKQRMNSFFQAKRLVIEQLEPRTTPIFQEKRLVIELLLPKTAANEDRLEYHQPIDLEITLYFQEKRLVIGLLLPKDAANEESLEFHNRLDLVKPGGCDICILKKQGQTVHSSQAFYHNRAKDKKIY